MQLSESHAHTMMMAQLVCASRNGPDGRSTVNILEATGDLYAAVIDDKLAVKLGPADWDPQARGIKLGGGKEPKLAVTGFQ